MAKYRIETSRGTFEVEADSEPSIKDVEAALAAQEKSTPDASTDTRSKVENVLGNPYMPKINDRSIMSTGDPGEVSVGFAKHIADTGLEGGGAVLGQAAGAPLAPLTFGASVPVLGAVGAGLGNAASQTRGLLMGDRQKFSMGELGGAMVTGAVPGGKTIASGLDLVKAGAKNVATNLAAETVRTGLDLHRLPNASESTVAAIGGVAGAGLQKALDTGKAGREVAGLMEQDAAENAIIKTAKDNGYVLPPSKINPNAVNAGADFLAGSDAISNIFSLKNQRTTNALAREYIKLPENATLNDQNIQKAISVAKQPYEELRALSPQADVNVDGFLQAKADANRAWRAYDHTPTPEILKVAKENDDLAGLYHDELLNEAQAAGMPRKKTEDRIQQARVALAKIHMVEQALGPDGNVNARSFANAVEQKRFVTDQGKVIGETASTFPTVTKDKRSIGAVGSGKVPILDKYIRAGMATDRYQNTMATPRYDSPQADTAANFGRLSAMLFTQEDPETEQARKTGSSLAYLMRAGAQQ